MSDERDRLVKWLTDILQAHDIAPSDLAKRAGLAPSTLTRFLSDADAPLLSTRTVSKVDAVVRTLGQHRPGGFSEQQTRIVNASATDAPLARVIAAALADRPQAYVAQLGEAHDLAAMNFCVGDYIFVDPAEMPVAGQIACAQTVDWQSGQAVTVYRLFDPPYLIGGDLTGPRRKPLIVDNDQVVLRGRVYGSLRWLA